MLCTYIGEIDLDLSLERLKRLKLELLVVLFNDCVSDQIDDSVPCLNLSLVAVNILDRISSCN